VGESLVSDPLSSLGVLLDEVRGSLDDLSGSLSSLLGDTSGVGPDGLVGSRVDGLEGLSIEDLVPLFELLVEFLGVLGLEVIEVLLDVNTEDVFSVLSGVELADLLVLGLLLSSLVDLGLVNFDVHTWESSVLVGDEESTVAGSLHSTEDTVSSGGSVETDIKEGLEGSSFITMIVSGPVLSINLVVSWEHFIHVL